MNDEHANSCRTCMFHTTDPRMTHCPTCPGNPKLVIRIAAPGDVAPQVAETRCPGCGDQPADPKVVSVGFTWHLGCFTAAQRAAQPAPQLILAGAPTKPPAALWTPEPWRRW